MSTFDDILIADTAQQLTEFGTTGAVYQPATGAARTITIIVMAQPPDLTDKPRTEMKPVRVQTANAAATGILRSEWTNRDTLTFDAGDGVKTHRILRPVHWDAGMVTWEVD